jgi:hypothetical protein
MVLQKCNSQGNANDTRCVMSLSLAQKYKGMGKIAWFNGKTEIDKCGFQGLGQ